MHILKSLNHLVQRDILADACLANDFLLVFYNIFCNLNFDRNKTLI